MGWRKKYTLAGITFTCLLVLQFPAVSQQTGNDTLSLFSKLQAYFSRARQLNKFNGNVLVAKNGQVIFQRSYGVKNANTHRDNDSNTVFQIASITKEFTATLILILQEEGRLSVQDKLSKYFQDYRYADKITIEHLLTHQSGIYDYTGDIDENDSAIVCNPVTKQRVLDIFYNKPLNFKPGKKFSYCNTGYFLLGMIIEKITGISYEQAMRAMIFTPLGLQHTGFNFRTLPEEIKAIGYKTLNSTDTLIAQRWDSTVTYAAGGIYSNIADLYKWMQAIAHKQLISAASWDQAFIPRMEQYGYGFWIEQLCGKKMMMHSGGMPGFQSCCSYFPEDDLSIILLNNVGNYGQSLVAINGAIAAIVFNKPYFSFIDTATVLVDKATMQSYTGRYEFDKAHPVSISLENGKLQIEAKAGGLPKSTLYAKNDHLFFLKVIEATIEFIKNEQGQVIALIAHSNGKDEYCKKMQD